MSNIYSERIEALRALMKRDGVDYAIVFNSDSHMSEYIEDFYKFLEYLSGFTGSNATLLVSLKEAILWTDGRYFIQAKKELDGSGIELYKSQEKGVPTLREYLHRNAFDKVVATTGTLISRHDYEELASELSSESNFRIDTDYATELWTDRPKKNNNKIRLLPKSIAGQNIEEKMSALREKMAEYKADAFFVSDLADIMWLFNIRGTDIEYSPLANAYAFVARQKAGLYIDEKAAPNELYAQANYYGGLIRPYSDIYTCLNFPEGCRILCDKRSMNARLYEDLTNLGNELIDVPHDKLIPKSVKNKTEIKNAVSDLHHSSTSINCSFVATSNASILPKAFASFLAAVSPDRVQLVKTYPESSAQARFKIDQVSTIYAYCNKDGLFKTSVI